MRMRRSPLDRKPVCGVRRSRLVNGEVSTQVSPHRREARHPQLLADRVLNKRLDVGGRNHVPVSTYAMVQLHVPLALACRLVRTALECRHRTSILLPIVGINLHPIRFRIPARKARTAAPAANEMFLVNRILDCLILRAIRSRQRCRFQAHTTQFRGRATNFRIQVGVLRQVLMSRRMVPNLMPLLCIIQMRLRIATKAHRVGTNKECHRHIRHIVQEGQVVRLRVQTVIECERRRPRVPIPGNSGNWARKSRNSGQRKRSKG